MGIVVYVLWQISYAFRQCKNFENWLRFDKVTGSLKVETFLRHSVVLTNCWYCNVSVYKLEMSSSNKLVTNIVESSDISSF